MVRKVVRVDGAPKDSPTPIEWPLYMHEAKVGNANAHPSPSLFLRARDPCFGRHGDALRPQNSAT